MCISVLVLNSVAEVLEKHVLQKPISYVKNSQNSEEEAHQLMVKLCRYTGRRYELRKLHSCMNVDTYKPKCLSGSHKLTEHLWVCVSRNPPVSETVWRSLLQDLLDMQQNVYTCLKPETCHQVLHCHNKAKDYTEDSDLYLIKTCKYASAQFKCIT